VSTETEPSLEQKVYHPLLASRNSFEAGSFAILSLFIGLLLLWFLLNPQYHLIMGMKLLLSFMWIIAAFISVGACLWRVRVNLVISTEGIVFSRPGFRIFTSWDNVECIGTRREIKGGNAIQAHSVNGLKLRQPAPVYQVSPLALWMLMGVEGDPSCFIPINDVRKDWQDSEIAEDIRRYAPEALKFYHVSK